MVSTVLLLTVWIAACALLLAAAQPHGGRCPKVVFMVIASPSPTYDAMKALWIRHWEQREHLADSELWFLHGIGSSGSSDSPSSKYDHIYHDVEESIVPGGVDKTMRAFKECLATTNADIIIRTNLSSVYIWDRAEAFLRQWDGDVAGYSPDESHFSGCNMIMSHRAVQWLLNHQQHVDRWQLDDVTMSRVFLEHGKAAGLRMNAQLPRYDIVYDDRRILHATSSMDEVFHIRLKQFDRTRDVDNMDLLISGQKNIGTI